MDSAEAAAAPAGPLDGTRKRQLSRLFRELRPAQTPRSITRTGFGRSFTVSAGTSKSAVMEVNGAKRLRELKRLVSDLPLNKDALHRLI
jgi:hypothetical protein